MFHLISLMKNLLTLKNALVCFAFFLFVHGAEAQVTWTFTGCNPTSPTIDKVFVDACANPEGYNEFAYLTVGTVAWDWSNLEITGANIGYQAGPNTGTSPIIALNQRPISSGFTSNPSVVAALNTGVGACATPVFQVAPPILCPGDAVIIRMSGQPVTLANSIAGLCGKGPIYVLTGTYNSANGGSSGFFNNGRGLNCTPSAVNNPCERIADFNLGNGCTIRMAYDVSTFPQTNNNSTGAYALSNGTANTTSSCYELPSCTNPAPPLLNTTKIEWCDDVPMPSTKITCSNCYRCQYFIYDAPTGGTLIYSGASGTWPNAGFVAPIGYNTYYIENKFSFCSSTRTPVQINRKPIPVIVPIPDKVFCESNSCITLNIQGTANATYTLSPSTGVTNPNSNNPIVCNTGNTVYTIKSTLDGCMKTEFVNFSTNTSLNNTGIAPPVMINCLTPNAILDASPKGSNFTYNWSHGSTNSAPSVTIGGTYTVTITDSNNGCTRTATTTVIENKEKPVITPFAPIKLTCANGFPTIPVSVTGSNLQYNWSANVFGSPTNPTVSIPGTYTLTVTNSVSGCTDIKSVVVTSDKNEPNAVVAPVGQINCINSSVSFNTAGTSTGPNFTYSWTGPGYSSTSLTPPAVTQGGTYTFVVTDITNGCTKSVTMNVSENTALPIVTAGSNQSLNCYNGGSVLLGINGPASYTYLWSSGQTDGTIGVSTPGTYTLTVTDSANGCTRVSSATVTANNTPPTVSPIPPVTVTCANPNPTLVVTASGGTNLAYNWSPSGSGANSTVTTGGVYTVTVVNTDNGCKTSVSVTVGEDKVLPEAVIAAPDILNCYNNSSISLNTTGTSTGSPYTYQWTGPSQSGTTLPFPAITQPGTYTLIVTNPTNGCTKMASVNVVQNITPPNALAGPPQLLNCSNNGIVTIGTSTSPNYTYSWSNGVTTGTQVVTTPGNYTLVATDPINGCTISTTVTVTEDKSVPSITSIAPITITCANPSLTLNPVVTGNNLTYSWSPNGTGATPTITTPGTYTLTLTDSVSGCTDTKTVIVSEDKVAPTVTIAPALTLNCYNSSSVALDPTGTSTGANFTYAWSGAGGFSSNDLIPQNVTQAGTYILTVTNTINGCTKTASVTVTENVTPPAANVGAPKTLNCYNSNSVSIGGTAVPNYTYNWSNSNTSSSQTVTQTGTYILTVTDTVNGCSSIAQVTVNQDDAPPTADAGVEITINCYDPIKQLSATAGNGTPLGYAWSGAGLVGGTNTLTPSVNQGGIYILTVTNITNGCTAVSQVNVVSDKNAPTVAASVAGNLDCNVTTTNLDGNGSSVGANYTFQWTGPNGFSDNSSLTPNVTLGGNYTLVITNSDNGCTSTKTIFVNQDITPPTATIVSPTLLSCDFPIVNLQPNAPSNSAYFYTWTTSNGNFSSGTSSYSAQVDRQGTYTLVVINTANGCSATANTTVVEDKAIPTAIVAPANDLTCPVPQIQLSGAGSSVGNDITYIWTTGTGSIINGVNTLFPTVNNGGNYTLTVKNNTNGCLQTASVSVNDNRIYPVINILNPQVVTCKNPNVQIDATNSSNGSGFTYQWTAINGGVIDNGATTLTPVVTKNGVYQLVITNTGNACSSTQTTIVNQDKTAPSANAGPNKLLTCTDKTVQLSGSGSAGSNMAYAWGSAAGAVQIGGTTLSPTVSQATVYTLTVTNTVNGCSAISSVSVTVDTNVPTADAGAQKIIDCNVAQVSLDGTKSNNGGQYSYTWTSANGAFVSGKNTLQPIVNKPGIYNLKIKNNINNCEADASVEVVDNRIRPTIVVVKPKDVNCAQPQIQLDAKASSLGADFTYAWTTTNGTIVSNANTNFPTISKSGDYVLKIKNNSNGCERDTSISVKEFFNMPKANIQNSDIITCVKPNFPLDASGSTNMQNGILQWKLRDGASIISAGNTLKPIIDNSGFYKLILKDTISQCVDSMEIEVKKDANIPNADAGTTKELNCTIKDIVIQATASSAPTITYAWTTTGGNIVSGATTLTPKIDKSGVYTLTVSNSANQCVKIASVTITQDTVKPTILALPTNILNCKVTVVKIDASASATGSKFKPSWIDPQAGILSGATSLTPLVNKPGIYTLNIKNTGNTCESNLPVEIIQNIVKPTADATVKDTVTCRLPEVKIEGTVSASSGLFTFEWTTTNGKFSKDEKTLEPIVSQGGTYKLFVTDTVNFCVSNTQIEVIQNTKTPITDAGIGGNLTCAALQLDLNGTVQNGDTKDLIYTWTTPNGNILSGDKTLTIKVDVPGKYFLKIENKTNGCFTIDSTDVTQDANVPIVTILGGGKLDCATTTYTLDGSGSSQGAGITFEWSTKGGANILSGANTLKPVINGGGTYTLTIKNANNNCIKSIEKEIKIDTLHAEIDIEKAILTCKDLVIWIKSSVTKVTNYETDWSSQNTILTPTKNASQIKVDTKGFYKINVKNNDNQCVTTKNIEVFEDKVAPIADAGLPIQSICNDTAFVLNATKSSKGVNFTYLWSSQNGIVMANGTTLTPKVKPEATYKLFITNTLNGCTAEDTTLILNIKPKLNAAVVQHPLCFGGLGNLFFKGVSSGTPPFTYSIDGGKKYATQTEFLKLTPAIYDLKVQDANGCEDSLQVQIIEPPKLTVALPAIHKITIGDDVQFNAVIDPDTMKLVEIKWTPADSLTCGDCLNPFIIRPFRGGTFDLYIKNDKGCDARASTRLNVNKNIPVYAPTAFSPNGDKINDYFTLYGNIKNVVKINHLRIFDRWGTLVFEAFDLNPSIESQGWDGTFRGEPLNPAVFVWNAKIKRVDGEEENLKGDVLLEK